MSLWKTNDGDLARHDGLAEGVALSLRRSLPATSSERPADFEASAYRAYDLLRKAIDRTEMRA